MTGELAWALTAASGIVSLAIGLYVFFNNPRRLVNNLVLLMSVLLAIWALGDAMTMASTSLSDKIFWTKFQGLGQLPLIPTYLLIALYFPAKRTFMRGRRKAASIIAAIYAPFLLGLIFLYTTDLIYTAYLPADNVGGMAVDRTPYFWFLTALGLGMIFTTMGIYLWEGRRSTSTPARRSLLILALAPVPMIIANILQNFEISANITTPMASSVFVTLLAYGVMRYGLFVDIRSMTRGLLAHTVVIVTNVAVFSLICAFYYYGLGLRNGAILYTMCVITGIPFVLAYHIQVTWAKRLADRYLYGRELEEGRLLQELSHSIRTVRNLQELADDVVVKVRDSMDLATVALMLKDEDTYEVIGMTTHPDHMARWFDYIVKGGVYLRKAGSGYSFDSANAKYSGYWMIGNRVEREECVLSYMPLAILRVYEGDGVVREMLWREETEGEAVSVPLEIGGEEVGMLWLGGKMDRVRFSIDELDFIVALSVQVAVSLQNSLLLQELLDKSARLQELIQETTTAQEEERIRISRELHDGLAPYFLDIMYKIEALQGEIEKNPSIPVSLEEVREKAREGLGDLRQVIGDLRPSSLDVLGLEKSLASYVERFGVENDLEVEFSTTGPLDGLDSLVEVTVFRVAQEALSNVARHAHAEGVSISLQSDNGYLEMTVDDDGVGFVEREMREKMLLGESLGIKGMRERAELLQGSLSIHTRSGMGTSLRMSIPIKEE
jgi:signal transduction histidine kinase